MRVGIDVSPLTHAPTGVGRYTHGVLRAMLAGAECPELRGLATGRAPLDAEAIAGLARVRHLRIPTRAAYGVWSVLGAPAADTLLGGVDVYHATNYYLPPLRRARGVLTIYDLALLRHPDWASPKIRDTFRRHLPGAVTRAAKIIACSEATRQDAHALLGVPLEKVTVVYGGLDEGFSAPRPEDAARFLSKHYDLRPPYLLFVSTLEPRKNVLGLLEAYARIAREVPHPLVLVGGRGWQAGLDAQLARLGIAERVRRIGYVPRHADLAHFYALADLLVFPSFYEGFGLPLLEAMACGCPVLASTAGALPEVGGDAARYLFPADTAAWAESIAALLNDDASRAAMAAAGRARAQHFTWGKAAAQTLAVYREAAACAY